MPPELLVGLPARRSWGVLVLLLVGGTGAASAQELPLRRDLPPEGPVACPDITAPREPQSEEASQAARLGSDADQALILGDPQRARDLLARAVELNPSSVELAYRYARILETLGETNAAVAQFCRVLSVGGPEDPVQDARARLESLSGSLGAEIPQEAKDAFLQGIRMFDRGELQAAESAFGAALLAAPEWADPFYNRGLTRARLGRRVLAAADLQHYLELAPDAEDALQVSVRLGQLQAGPASAVAPGAALGLGLLFPGMGQFYSGRALGGFTVAILAGGAAAAGFLIEKETVRCVGGVVAGGECPPERVVDRETSRPYLVPGLAAAGVLMVTGAIEAYIKAGRDRNDGSSVAAAPDRGKARVGWPTVSARGRLLQLQLLRVRF